MPNQKGQKKVVNRFTIKKPSKRAKKIVDTSTIEKKIGLDAPVAEKVAIIPEEKVEVLIKEIIRINPRDFSAFKHALEEFVKEWDK